jgi:hypothetical protein
MKLAVILVAGLTLAIPLIGADDHKGGVLFQEIIDDMEDKSDRIRQHPFIDFLKDETISARRRMSFAPYLTYFAMSFADIVDTWLYVPSPQNELEERINIYIDEDDFHYNLLLHDIEQVLGYTLDRFGSYAAVMRHIWGDDTRAVREYIYAWLDCLNRYKDPIITLTTFEGIEVGAQPLVDAAYHHVFLPDNGIKGLLYFGQTHVDLEMNHTQFNWFNEKDTPVLPLGNIEITAEHRDRALEVSEEMYKRTWDMYDALHALAAAEEDSIWPEKYRVDDYPQIRAFPREHPNRKQPINQRDEL